MHCSLQDWPEVREILATSWSTYAGSASRVFALSRLRIAAVIRKFTPINLAAGSRTGAGPATSCDPAGGSCCCG